MSAESLTAAIKEKADKVSALKKAKEPKDVFMPFVLEMLALKKECDAPPPCRRRLSATTARRARTNAAYSTAVGRVAAAA